MFKEFLSYAYIPFVLTVEFVKDLYDICILQKKNKTNTK